jgi:hypothetical protein
MASTEERIAALEQHAALVSTENLSGLTTTVQHTAVDVEATRRELADFRAEVADAFASLRAEVADEFTGLRTETTGLREQLATQAEQLAAINGLLVRLTAMVLPAES